jgi:hypothetical protein
MIALGALALTAGSAPAFARDAKPVSRPEASTEAAKAKRYCVVSRFTGSRLGHKTCKTRAEWLEEDGFDPLAPAAK